MRIIGQYSSVIQPVGAHLSVISGIDSNMVSSDSPFLALDRFAARLCSGDIPPSATHGCLVSFCSVFSSGLFVSEPDIASIVLVTGLGVSLGCGVTVPGNRSLIREARSIPFLMLTSA